MDSSMGPSSKLNRPPTHRGEALVQLADDDNCEGADPEGRVGPSKPLIRQLLPVCRLRRGQPPPNFCPFATQEQASANGYHEGIYLETE